jgi:hypothetical protein
VQLALGVPFRRREALEVVERKLGVDRQELLRPDDGVDALAGAECVLKLVCVGRQAVGQKLAQQQLADAAASLGGSECLLQPREIVRPLEHLRCARVELSESIDDLRCRLPRVLLGRKQTPIQALEATVDALVDLAKASPESILGVLEPSCKHDHGRAKSGGDDHDQGNDQFHSPQTLAPRSDANGREGGPRAAPI